MLLSLRSLWEASGTTLQLTGTGAGVGGSSDGILEAARLTGTGAGVAGSSATLTVSAALSGSSAGIGASSGVLTAAEALTGLSGGVGGSSGVVTQTGGVTVDTSGGRLPLIVPRRVKAPLPPLVKTRIQLPGVAEVTVRSDDDVIVALYVAGALDLEEFAALIAA